MTDQPFIGPVLRRAVPTHCMNWNAYGLRQIWHMLESETDSISLPQVMAWGRMKSMCESTAARLRQAAAELAVLWPPDRSPAARAYQDVVLTMAKSMDDSAAAAHANANALADLTDGIAQTRQKIAQLVDELNAREAEHDRNTRMQLPWWPDTDLIDQQRAKLDDDARQIMHDADAIPATAVASFRIPYSFGSLQVDEDRRPLSPGLTTADTTLVDSSGQLLALSATAPWQPPTVDQVDKVPKTSPLPADAGVPVLATTATDASTVSMPLSPFELALGDARALPPTVLPGSHRVPGLVLAPPGWNAAREPVDGARSAVVRSALDDRPGRTGAAHATGSAGFLVPPTTAGRGLAPREPNARAGLSRSAGRRSRGAKVDPDDPWAVQTGGPAILLPSLEPEYHDPGPGVFGIDR